MKGYKRETNAYNKKFNCYIGGMISDLRVIRMKEAEGYNFDNLRVLECLCTSILTGAQKTKALQERKKQTGVDEKEDLLDYSEGF